MESNKYGSSINNSTVQSPSLVERDLGRGGIELRSEKVRNIIGKIPPVLIRYGTIIIGLALLTLFVVSAFIPYRETIPVVISVEKTDSKVYGKIEISKDRLSGVQIGNKVVINDPLIGYLEAEVVQISAEPIHEKGFLREVAVVFTPHSSSGKIQDKDVMEGRIVLSDTPVLRKFLQSTRMLK